MNQEDLNREKSENGDPIPTGLTELAGKLEGGLIRGLFTQGDRRKKRSLRSANV